MRSQLQVAASQRCTYYTWAAESESGPVSASRISPNDSRSCSPPLAQTSSGPLSLISDPYSDLVCLDVDTSPRTELRGDRYWVLYNYIGPARSFSCNESVTYTTHGDLRFLGENLGPLLRRWKGPVSVGVFAPGDDYLRAVDAILNLRECSRYSDLVREFSSFHLFFPVSHFPPKTQRILSQEDLARYSVDCGTERNYTEAREDTYQASRRHDLTLAGPTCLRDYCYTNPAGSSSPSFGEPVSIFSMAFPFPLTA